MDLKTTLYAVDDRIATITLNRPHRGNAWTGRMHTEYRHLLDQAEKDPDVRAILVTGSGDRFCVRSLLRKNGIDAITGSASLALPLSLRSLIVILVLS